MGDLSDEDAYTETLRYPVSIPSLLDEYRGTVRDQQSRIRVLENEIRVLRSTNPTNQKCGWGVFGSPQSR